jgi:hypothetical protein
MMEVKVQCDCGQKYKFDVEPVNGRMPFTVACPICGADGTDKANAILRETIVYQIPAPPSWQPPTPPPQPAPEQPGLRVNIPSAGAPSPSTPPPISPLPALPAPIGQRGTSFAQGAAAGAQPKTGRKPSFALGLLGGFLGALVGAAIYFAIFKITGPFFMLRYVLALGVGGLTGWLAHMLGKGEGSKELGGLAAAFTVVGILAAQYFLTLEKWHSNEDLNNVNQAIQDGGYAESVKQAKEVVKAIPTGSDAEIRMYIAKQQAEEGQPPKPETIGNDEVKVFRDNELTNYLDLASGKLTKEAFWAKNGFDPKQAKKILDTEDTAESGLAVIVAIFKAGIISMIVGAGVAYKLSTNA